MKRNQHTDVELIQAYQTGDKQALALLVKRWHIEFCKKAHWIVKDVDVSKDVAQESWRTIMDKLHTLQKPSSFKSWAFRIVFSKSMDALRKQSRERSNESTFKKEHVSEVEDYNDNEELKVALLKALKTLPEQQQIVVRLFYNEAYSLKDISKTLEISVGTAKSRLFHAREKLKLILQQKKHTY